MSLHHIRRPHYGLGIDAGAAVLHRPVEVEPGVWGRALMVMSDGADDLLIAVDVTRGSQCPRCGHDEPRDPSQRPDGDHLIHVQGPLTFERLGRDVDANLVRFETSQPFLMVWCSEKDTTLANLAPTIERQHP